MSSIEQPSRSLIFSIACMHCTTLAPQAHDGEVGAFADGASLADRQGVLVLGNFLADRAVDALWLEEQHGIRIAQRGNQQTLRVVRRARHHDLESRRVRVDRFGRIAVQFRSVNAAADGNADRHRDGERAAGASAHARGVRADLVVGRPEESLELNLGHRMQSAHRHADREADDSRLRERRVEHAVAAESLLQTLGHTEDAAIDADILAEKHDVVILLHLLDESEVDGLDKIEICHGRSSSSSFSAGQRRQWLRRRVARRAPALRAEVAMGLDRASGCAWCRAESEDPAEFRRTSS